MSSIRVDVKNKVALVVGTGRRIGRVVAQLLTEGRAEVADLGKFFVSDAGNFIAGQRG